MKPNDKWQTLKKHYSTLKHVSLRELFAQDPERASRFSLETCGLFLDYSKNLITNETMEALLKLADQSDLRKEIDAMFSGQKSIQRKIVRSSISPCEIVQTLR